MSPIHKPLDRALKTFLSEALRLFLHVAGVVSLEADANIEVLSAETAPPVRIPDFVARVRVGTEREFILHIEFEVMWQSRTPALMARRGASLAWQYLVPVYTLVVLAKREGCPSILPTSGMYAIGETHTTHPFRTVRLWELDPTLILESNNPRIFPWVVLMKSTDEQVREIASVVRALHDEDLTGLLSIVGTVRYDKDEWEQMTGGSAMDLVEFFARGSWVFREARQEGRVEEARGALRDGLAVRFPGLETMPELDLINDPDTLRTLTVTHIINISDRSATEAAIRSAGRSI